MTDDHDDLALKLAIVSLLVTIAMIGTLLLLVYVIFPWLDPPA